MQGGQTPDDPAVQAILECRERLGPVIALVLDFSVSMTAVPASFADAVRRAGMPANELADIVSLWDGGAPTGEVLAAIGAAAAPTAAQDEARAGFFRFGRQAPEAWLPLVPVVAHAHAKFWQLDETGDEPTVDNAALFACSATAASTAWSRASGAAARGSTSTTWTPSSSSVAISALLGGLLADAGRRRSRHEFNQPTSQQVKEGTRDDPKEGLEHAPGDALGGPGR